MNNTEENKFDSLTIQLSKDLVSWFAKLTGDYSSLHTRENFGRDSMYRSNVVHGILPLAFLPVLSAFNVKNSLTSLKKISANFIKPAFIGDKIVIKTKPIKNNENKIQELEYSIENANTKSILTSGSCLLDVQSLDILNTKKNNAQGKDESIILDSLKEQTFQFEDIKKGDSASFNFAINHKHLALLNSAMTGQSKKLSELSKYNHIPNSLAILLLSTFAGMCIPGRYATIMNFSFVFKHNIEWSKIYRLIGQVSFCSRSTNTLVNDITIHEEGKESAAIGMGKIQTKVNEPPPVMPSFVELKKDAELKLKDKVIVITGASGGIGETTAKLCSLYGAKIVVNYCRGKENAKRIVKEIKENGGEAIDIQANITERSQVDEMIKIVQQKYKKVDVLVNNAAHSNHPASFMEETWEKIQKDMDVTIKGTFNCIQSVLPDMIKHQSGKIINISTVYTDNPPAKQVSYAIAKSGLVGLTRGLAVECAPHGITVNMVVPSIVETNFSRHVSKIFLQQMKNSTPMKRNASPVDVAKAVVMLASNMTTFTTGQKIMVTGGNPPFL